MATAMVPQPLERAERWVRRFDQYDLTLHLFMMVAFLGLAATGLPLLFSDAPWAARLARLLGGFEAAGAIHRLSAALMIAVFVTHLGRVAYRLFVLRDIGVLRGPSSMVPQPKDIRDIIQHFRWFVGRGERPRFDRYAYWEKFDYLAVFWGMAIIGGSGLMLWFPEFFARLVPGWVFNIVLLVHGEEALLAVGFIFTVHFFNSHLRPEKFPMDMVIFTGRVRESELREERPLEFERLERLGQLDRRVVPAPSPQLWRIAAIVGTMTVATGLVLVSLIVYAFLG